MRSGLRVLAHRQPDARGAGEVPGLAGGRGARARLRLGLRGDRRGAVDYSAPATTWSPETICTAARIASSSRVWRPMGVSFSYVDARRPEAIAEALGVDTRLIWIETPSNPLLRLADIPAVAGLARDAGVPLAVDNTFATPCLPEPDSLSVRTSSCTARPSTSAGTPMSWAAPCSRRTDELHEQMKFYQNSAGAVPGAFDAWLTLRGVKTLGVRMQRHAENALLIAAYLQ